MWWEIGREGETEKKDRRKEKLLTMREMEDILVLFCGKSNKAVRGPN